jgi:SpoVK/Ycf46/Vps4 family AAA+-type ATPase
MQEYSDVDSYLGTQAKILSRLLEDGAEVDEMLEDELLGTEKPSLPSVVKKPLSGDFNYAKYDNSDNVVVEMRQLQEAMSKSPFTFGGADKEKKGDGDFKSPYMSLLKPQDSLNLQGILNVLDGVVDTPARIIVMTTNHPEQLDPALIRPGRIDKKLHLGYMGASDISQMLEHYFETKLKETYKLRIQATIAGNVRDKRPALHLTPAQVEQMASEFETVDEMIHAIEEKASNIATAPSKLGATSSSEIAFGL